MGGETEGTLDEKRRGLQSAIYRLCNRLEQQRLTNCFAGNAR
jgi:hypothetical protein